MRKSSIAIILILSIIVGLLSGCKKEDVPPAEYVTRGEWVSMLAEAFGWENYQTDTLAYSDVTAADPLFPSVQAATGWGALPVFSDEALEAEKAVTRREAASSAAIAAGFSVDESQVDAQGRFDPQPSIDYAVQYGILLAEADDQPMTKGQCEAVIDAALAVYMENPGEETLIAVPNPERVDLSGLPNGLLHVDGDKISIPAAAVSSILQNGDGNLIVTLRTDNGAKEIGVGKTFVTAPQPLAPFGVAYKVTALEETADGGVTLTTAVPTLADLYHDVDIHTTVSLEDSYIVWADGVDVSPVADPLSATGESYHIELLTTSSGELQPDTGDPENPGPPWHFSLPKGGRAPESVEENTNTMEPGEAREALQSSSFIYNDRPSLEDFNGSTEPWSVDLKPAKKFTAGYQISGTIDPDLEVATDVEYHTLEIFGEEIHLWPKEADLTVRSDLTATLGFEGTLEGEVEIAELCIPLGTSGFTVNGRLFLYAGANGSIQIGVELINDFKVEWKDTVGFCNPYVSRREANPEMKGALDLTFGAGVGLSLNVLKSCEIIGADLKAGGDLEATASVVGSCAETEEEGVRKRTYTEALKLNSAFYLPIVSVEVRGPEIFDWKHEFPITTKENAHKFPLYDDEIVFWTKTVELDGEGNPILPTEGPLAGDFSEFAGRYLPDAAMQESYQTICSDLTVSEDGTATGDRMFLWDNAPEPYANTAPIRVTAGEESEGGPGTFECVVAETPATGNEDHWDGYKEYYVIYPPGISDLYTEGSDTTKTRIRYVIAGGGVFDMLYTKLD